jgi:hemerythrin
MIERVEFSDKYRLGVLAIDRQHEHIFTLFNHFADALEGGEVGLCWPFVEEIYDSLRNHFAEEEKIMENLGLSGLEGHKAHHAHFLDRSSAQIAELCEKTTYVDLAECYKQLLYSFLDDVVDADFHIFMNSPALAPTG